ncbi:hypothetical protein KSP39_PZI016085 [Platanthera zijinensis]|uniref:Uncharacterized protein n=1 Tax=Platanthera zijinensis TaxID=2320716 RepID=A0AAP0G0N0_9ASPA
MLSSNTAEGRRLFVYALLQHGKRTSLFILSACYLLSTEPGLKSEEFPSFRPSSRAAPPSSTVLPSFLQISENGLQITNLCRPEITENPLGWPANSQIPLF